MSEAQKTAPIAAEPQAQPQVAPESPPPKKRRWLLWWLFSGPLWLYSLLVAALLLVLLGVGVWAGREGSLPQLLGQLQKHGLLQEVSEAKGSVLRGGQIGRLVYASDGVQVELGGVALQWQAARLLTGRLQVNGLSAQSLRLYVRGSADEDPEPSQPPKNLSLPLRVALDQLQVGDMAVFYAQAPARPQALKEPTWAGQNLAADYRYNGKQHSLNLHSLHSLGGDFSGQAQAGAWGKMPLAAQLKADLKLAVAEGEPPLPVQAELSVDGPLQDFAARLQINSAAAQAAQAMRADVSAQLKLWTPLLVYAPQGELQGIDLAAFAPSLPHTRISGRVQPIEGGASRHDASSYAVEVDLHNALSQPWDAGGLPLERVQGRVLWQDEALHIQPLNLSVGQGQLQAGVSWQQAANVWQAKGEFARLDLAQLHTAMAALPLQGDFAVQTLAQAGEYEGVDFKLQAHSSGAASGGDKIALQELALQGRLQGQALDIPQLQVRLADAHVQGQVQYGLESQNAQLDIHAQAPGFALQAKGALAAQSGGGQWQLDWRDAAATRAWLNKLPGLQVPAMQGQASGSGQWQGGWQQMRLAAEVAVPQLSMAGSEGSADVALKDWHLQVQGPLSALAIALKGDVQHGPQRLNAQWQAAAQVHTAPHFKLGLDSQQLQVRLDEGKPSQKGEWRLTQAAPVRLSWDAGQLQLAAGRIRIEPPASMRVGQQRELGLEWHNSALHWGDKGLRSAQTSGQMLGVPNTWLEGVSGFALADAGLSGQMLLDARWSLRLENALQLQARIERRSGDLRLEHVGRSDKQRPSHAGLRDAYVQLTGQGERLQVQAVWDSAHAGQFKADVASRLSRGADGSWGWPESSPLQGHIKAQLPELGFWSALAPTGWRVSGGLDVDAQIGGSRQQPNLGGYLRLSDLNMRSVIDGIEFKDGQMRARFIGSGLEIEQFRLAGSEGELTGQGRLGWQGGQPSMKLDFKAEELRVSNRPDRRVSISGDVQAALAGQRLDLKGSLRTDEALILLADSSKPSLGDDVKVLRRKDVLAAQPNVGTLAELEAMNAQEVLAAQAAAAKALQPWQEAGQPLQVNADVELRLGRNFRVRGMGLDTRLVGALKIETLSRQASSTGEQALRPEITGRIRTVDGEYRAYGQWLTIEDGLIRFTGPYNNPSLDVLAVRPRTEEKVGVRISGPANNPRVALYSENAMPDSEKLAWLILGREGSNGGAEAAMLQQAAVALLGGGGTGGGLAQSFGLDEIGYRSAETNSDGTVRESSVSIGKRLSDKLYLSYERSLSGALGTLYVFYDITRRFTLRAQSNEEASALDLIFTRRYQEWGDSWADTGRGSGRRRPTSQPSPSPAPAPEASIAEAPITEASAAAAPAQP